MGMELRGRAAWAAWVTVLIMALLILLAGWLTRAGAAPAADYRAQNWYVNMNPNTCQDATIGGPMPHGAPVQVLIYPVGSGQPVYANVFYGVGSTFTETIHLNAAMQQWRVVELSYEGAPWLLYDEEADCYSGPSRAPPK